jgi:general secretion pathway protein D
LTEENTRVIDSGTGQGIELRRGDPDKNENADNDEPSIGDSNGTLANLQTTSAANAASAMINQIAAQGQPTTSINSNPAKVATEASSSQINLTVVPAKAEQSLGSTFKVAVTVSNARDLFSAPFQLQFDPKVLSLVDVDSGEFFGRDGQAAALVHRDEGGGLVTISETRPPHTAGMNGQGTLCTLTFKALAPGSSSLSLVKIGAKDSKQISLPAIGTQAAVHVQ